jgi:endonuclease/exonuclease/phosphatase family metal-dependent hydrolase
VRRRELLCEVALFALAAACGFFGFGLPPLLTGAPGFTPEPRESDTLRIVTWNVGGALGGRTRPLDDSDVPAVVAALQRLDADLVVLQEVGTLAQFERVRGGLGAGWSGRRDSHGIAVLARDSAVGPVQRIEGARRGLVLELERDGRRLAVAALHADAFDARARNRAIGAAVDALLAREADLFVLLGDLNLDVDLDRRRDLFSDDSHLDVETYNYAAQRLADAASGRGATAEPDRRLDYVFVSRGTEVLAAGPWKGQRTGAMDHDPVVADIKP